MDYKVLYRKYRPCNFSQLIGQDNIKDILDKFYEKSNLGQKTIDDILEEEGL